ncbi:PREDICTED: neurogenic locus notch homolog protein 1-like [Branchiostoma belcheri]|uniref:Neurogenic locus notch homolog protein 1-like n=1 Tax=Branchiostoma belcheri TaxID=7741 RepID=A0A6P4Z9Q1_BRABE|nr:PREDICTED: neurogenic locus notch homolog protein 1-like [Branchiostoma belcheri]
MSNFLLLIAAVVAWPASAQGEQVYLATHDTWAFYKVRVNGSMSNDNVKETCTSVGMRYLCYYSGAAGCPSSHWTSDCITYVGTGPYPCSTPRVLSIKLCVTADPRQCQHLDDTFVYMPGWRYDDSAWGVDYDTHTYNLQGANYNNKYALCAVATTCAASPCAHGTCTGGDQGYICTCESGWTGRNCDQDIDECSSSPCAHGTCTDGVASYTCSCENGWTGNNCDQNIDDCLSSPCAHGTCTDGVASYTCSCENGWTGNNCDQDIDECLSSPCAHGTCTDGVASYTCSCESGWTGNNCDIDIDECSSSPCQLGGTCLDHVNGYSCVCPKETTGKDCETASFAGDCYQFSTSAATHRDATQACSANSGRMVDLRDPQQQQFLANTIAASTGVSNWLAMKTAPLPILYSDGSPVSAPLQWSVDEVSSPLDLCVLLDSSNNYKANKAFCTEQHNYVCMSALKPCEPNVCQNGGNCSSCFGESTNFCECLDGFDGKTCEINTDWCSEVQCPHGFVCQDFTFYFVCVHEQVYLTTHDTWAFYKVRVNGAMTNHNVKETCTAAGMDYPCYRSGTAGCTHNWTSGCITYVGTGSGPCYTPYVLSTKLCGTWNPAQCQPLDDTFVYIPGWLSDDSAYGVDYDTHNYGLHGASYNNMYVLCADINECLSSPCAHGTCTDRVASYTCSCENGWTGNNCDQDIDECLSSPCAHGTCTDGVASYTCSCESGWTGNNNCDQDIDECASNPCQLGGTCLDHVNGYSCVCPKETTGKHCETASFAGDCYQFSTSAATHRDATQACSANSGRMVDLRDPQQQQFLANTIAASTGVSNWLAMKTAPLPILYSDGSPVQAPLQWLPGEPSSPLDLCVLLDSSNNYQAKTVFCTEQHNYVCMSDIKPCEPNVCQNGGNCTSCFGESTNFCDCLDGFEGLLCETDTDECASNPCQHGGTCQDQVNSYSCRCPTGYNGDNCQVEIDWCSMVTCPFDWTCQNLITHFSCLAPTVRLVEPYQCSSASCPDGMYCTQEGVAAFSCRPDE